MARFFPPRHGRTHLPGGSDPIPFNVSIEGDIRDRPIILEILVTNTITGSSYQPIDWTDAYQTRTNDPTGSSTLSTFTDPFTGSWYETDWGTDPTEAFRFLQAGIYVWSVRLFGGSTELTGIPPYTVLSQVNWANGSGLNRYVGDPDYGQAELGGPTLEEHHSGIAVITTALVNEPFDVHFGSNMQDLPEINATLYVAKVADFNALDHTLTATLTGPGS